MFLVLRRIGADMTDSPSISELIRRHVGSGCALVGLACFVYLAGESFYRQTMMKVCIQHTGQVQLCRLLHWSCIALRHVLGVCDRDSAAVKLASGSAAVWPGYEVGWSR